MGVPTMWGPTIALSMGPVNKRPLNPLCVLIVLAAALAAAGPAAADVVPEGTGEPAYTNSTQNTQWFRTTVPSGTGSYRLKVSYYANNALVKEETVNSVSSGVFWANWSGVATL
jgi:TRAP-type C4-dicarboxylate transport system substrate-binding protein